MLITSRNKMHFLIKIFKNKIDEPIHKKFIRYSKGKFKGPQLEISERGKKFYFYSDRDYDEYFLEYVIKNLSDGEYKLTGNIICKDDFSKKVEDLGLECKSRKSRGMYIISVNDKLSAERIEEIYEQLVDFGYLLFSISSSDRGNPWKIKMKKSIPRPSGKKKDEDKKPNFCKGNVPSEDEVLKRIIDDCLLDFIDIADELKDLSFKKLELENIFDIKKIVLPEPELKDELMEQSKKINRLRKESNKKDIDTDRKKELKKEIKALDKDLQERSKKFRESTKREGTIIRNLIIDEEKEYTNTFDFVA